jgi:2-desacetyl-2-hydroxyethyl bacteriochlorophyllide A dehydrogenase
MKMAMVHAPGDLRLDEVERPVAGPKDIVIKVVAAGICGTDLHLRRMGPRFSDRPLALGHEYAGVIVEAGAEVQRYKVGDRVAYNSNNSPADMGRGGEFGGLGEYVALRGIDAHPQSLCPVPDNVSFDHAALVEPMSVAAHAVNRGGAKPGESVALFGSGPIGLGVVMHLRMLGVDDIIVFEPSKLRRERALSLGAKAAFDPRESPPAEVLRAARGTQTIFGTEQIKTDLYIETSGAPGVIPMIVDFCERRCRLVTLAMHREPLVLDCNKIMSKEVGLIGSCGYPHEFPEVMGKLEARSVEPEAMITHRFPFSDFLHAFKVADDANEAAKVLLTFE